MTKPITCTVLRDLVWVQHKQLNASVIQSLTLHTVCIKSNYVSGDVTVGIVNKILIDGVDMLLENDLASGNVEICVV